MANVFILCYFGELIKTKHELFSMELYKADWWAIKDFQIIKDFLFVYANSQREVGLMKGHFGLLSFEAFGEVIETIYSIVTLIISFIK